MRKGCIDGNASAKTTSIGMVEIYFTGTAKYIWHGQNTFHFFLLVKVMTLNTRALPLSLPIVLGEVFLNIAYFDTYTWDTRKGWGGRRSFTPTGSPFLVLFEERATGTS